MTASKIQQDIRNLNAQLLNNLISDVTYRASVKRLLVGVTNWQDRIQHQNAALLTIEL